LNRTKPNRKKRPKKILFLVRIAVVLVMIGGIAAGGAAILSWFDRSEYLRIQSIDLEGLNHLTEERVMNYMATSRNQSLLKVNLDLYRRRLESDPWVKSVYLKRHFPDRLEVKIIEKNPVGYIREGSEFYLLDEEGRNIQKDAAALKGLPEIKGVHLSKWMSGDEKEIKRVQRAVAFIQSTMKPNFLFAKEDLTAILLQTDDDLEATIGGSSFLFRYPYPAQQWLRFLSVKNDILTRNLTIEKIDLRYTGKVIVRPFKEKA
jgi:cell division septal protein FtsQ